ncbi:hypothetical protein [Maricaulis virginensis]|uniref:Uncharacterized protein n=1 Tax=Maricaulis virginensis TaxID=144022 RepID=A0A9W6MMP3_9PROT|nr:hypothetical protein [Maricaulis virginensis]GLK51223.1 hypothetical protein GCM10017621_07310 [Maricaulis virginensis]
MKFFSAVVAALVLTSAAMGQTLAIEDYVVLPNISNVRISPNGERLVFVSGDSWEQRNLIVFPLDGSQTPVVIDVGDDQAISNVFSSPTRIYG